mgnify:CR=1 FL=1
MGLAASATASTLPSKGLFLLAEKDVDGLDVRGQIKLKIGGR